MSADRRARLRDAIAGNVDPARLPGLDTVLDRVELVLDELDELGLAGEAEDALVEAAGHGVDVGGLAFEKSPARRGLDLLLERMPHLELVDADWQRPNIASVGGPWLLVTLGQQSANGDDVFARHPFAIWKRTGAVYGVDAQGAVGDDPLFELEP